MDKVHAAAICLLRIALNPFVGVGRYVPGVIKNCVSELLPPRSISVPLQSGARLVTPVHVESVKT